MFDVLVENIGVIFILLVIMWGLQFGMTYVQMRKYTKRLKIIRQDGLTAVGMGGSRYKGRAYGILTIDDNDKVIHAEKMSGWTNFAGLKPVPDLVGMNIEEIISDDKELPVSKKLKVAFQNAANDLLQARKDGIEFEKPSSFIEKKKTQGQ
jgi:DNA-binding transcriptional regulator of glucitol operon